MGPGSEEKSLAHLAPCRVMMSWPGLLLGPISAFMALIQPWFVSVDVYGSCWHQKHRE